MVERNKLEESAIQRFTKGILRGMKHLHDHDIVHGNLRAANVFVDQNVCQLADFGQLYSLIDRKQVLNNTYFHWTAPESLVKGSYLPTQKAHDVWSLGCTVFEMLTGRPPWQSCQISNLLLRINADKGHPNFPDYISDQLRDFVN